MQVTRGRHRAVTFPYPDVGPAQAFWGETSECICQGLRNVFEFAGGVPRRAVFDNATEVGGRVGSEVRLSELFRRFAAHYGLDHALANPYSGNEKGNVENKAGRHRRNPFVPVPSFHDVRAFNGRLLKDCLDPGDDTPTGGCSGRCARSPSSATPRTWSSTARPAGARTRWPPR